MRVLLLINAVTVPRGDAGDELPRKDYSELQRALHADTIDVQTLTAHWMTRWMRRLCGTALTQALLARLCGSRYDVIFADQEATGFALAAFYTGKRRRPRLVMLGHLLSSPSKQWLCRGLQLQRHIDCLIVHSSRQYALALRRLSLRSSQVALVPYQTDERFWVPSDGPLKNQICSAGLEYRDYPTLVQAVKDLDVDVVIAAASYWSRHRTLSTQDDLPRNVRVTSLGYQALRQLYAESLFVVVPLHDVENQAGITTILESMAMGKAVIVSHTRGQTDVVRDRRRRDRSGQGKTTQPDWAAILGARVETASSQTGLYVQPGNVDELRRAILYLLHHPAHAQTMGTNGRRIVEEVMGLDRFTGRIAALISGDSSPLSHNSDPLVACDATAPTH